MKNLFLIIGVLVLVFLMACSPAETVSEPEEATEIPGWYIPTTGEAQTTLSEAGNRQWTDFTFWDLGTLMPDAKPRIIDGDESFYVEMRGELTGSVVFNLRHSGIFPSDWQPRIVELYNDRVVVTIPDYAVWSDVAVGWGKGAISDTRKLDNGNYLFILRGKGVFKMVAETGEIVRFYEDAEVTHNATLLDNGNLLVCSARIDKAYEVTWDGEIVWEWDAAKEIKPYDLRTVAYWDLYPHLRNMYYEWRQGTDWMPINHVQKLANGHYLLSLKNQDLVLEVDGDNNVVWTFGPFIINHQHTPIRLDNGNTLIHDTGNNRIIEVTPEHELVWEYGEGMYSPVAGSAQRLPNGNTVMCDWFRGAAWEVTPTGQVVWEMILKAKEDALKADISPSTMPGFRVFRAWWYPE